MARTDKDHETKKLHDQARYLATKKLIEDHAMEYEISKHAFLTQLKREAGWTDGRPEANRRKSDAQ